MGQSDERKFEPAEVDALLETGGGLLSDIVSGEYQAVSDVKHWIGIQLGAWQITEFLDHGGMSMVFRGQRCDGQFEMPVAIKIIHRSSGVDLASRFDRERRILASLQHPHIGRILDGGETDGQPWLVMELIDGAPIDRYCDENRLTLRQRIRLVEQVCEAVRAAHTQLVVHRDIKPGNILVGHDGQARLLDFGIARILATESSDLTTQGPYLTPRFATPEMLTGEPVNVASDIYQIGLLLHFLLVGQHAQNIESTNLSQITAAVLDAEPMSPSQALSRISRNDKAAARQLAESRSSPIERLRSTLAGDLDAIVGTCLRKQPEHRYASVDGLLSDLRAWREQRPVVARAPTKAYRIGRFVHRHRGGVAASILMLLILIGSLISVTVSWRATLAAQRVAEQEAARAAQVTDLLSSTLEGADPDQSLGRDITVAEMLERTSRQAGTLLANQPETEASLRKLVGGLFLRLGRLQAARDELQSALELQHAGGPNNVSQVVAIETDLARALLDLGENEAARERATSAWKASISALGNAHPQSLESHLLVASIDRTLGNNDHARQVTEDIVQTLRTGPPNQDLLIAGLGQLAEIHTHMTDYPSASKAIDEAIILQRQQSSTPSMRLAELLGKQAGILTRMGDTDAILPAEEAVTITREIMGADHPLTAQALISRASFHSQQFALDHALADLEEAVSIFRQSVGDNHDVMGTLHNNMAVVRLRQEQFAQASESYTKSMAVYRSLYGEDHPTFLSTALYRAYSWHLAGDWRAESAYRELIPRLTEVRGAEHLHTSHVHVDLGRLLLETGRHDEAIAHLRQGLDIRENILGDGGRQLIADGQLYLGAALSESGDLERGGQLLEQGLAARQERTTSPANLRAVIAEAHFYLAGHRFRQGQMHDAQRLLNSAAKNVRELKSEGHWLWQLMERTEAFIHPR